MKFIAYTTKGLETIAAKEIQFLIKDSSIVEEKDKRIVFETKVDQTVLSSLKTVDDIGIYFAKIENLTVIDQIVDIMSQSNLREIKQYIKKFRRVNDSFSITASFVASPIKATEIIQVIKEQLIQLYGWEFTEREHSNFDLRVFIDRDEVVFSVRLTADSLHHRKYKTLSKTGSLKPTIAAAMVVLTTDFQTNLKIVDNFCGSGTILCEALLAGNEVYGGDIDPESVNITNTNLKNLYYSIVNRVKTLDATRTNWIVGEFDCAISNLPWDKQIEVSSITNLYEGTLKEYARILKPNGKLCVIISKPELFMKYAKKYFPSKKIEQFKIGLLGQTPTMVIVQ